MGVESILSRNDREFIEGYTDGRDRDAPEPSANRSHCYRHSFEVGRAELAGRPILATVSQVNAVVAEWRDNCHDA